MKISALNLCLDFWILNCLCAFYAHPASGGEIPFYYFSTPIRVLLQRGQKEISVESESNIFIRSESEKSWRIYPSPCHIRYLHEGGPFEVNRKPYPAQTLLVRGGLKPSTPIRFMNRRFRGSLRVSQEGQRLVITNVTGIEDYLLGTLPAEMNSHWELESLKAQAVASRTYALFMLLHPKHRLYDIESTIHDQVYHGVKEDSPRVFSAVSETAGVFLSKDGDPIQSFFHSRCGGTTENANRIWTHQASLLKGGITCPYCKRNPYIWSLSIKVTELLEELGLPISHLNLTNRSTGLSERVQKIRVQSGAVVTEISAEDLRRRLGYTRLKSALFKWRIKGDEIHFTGKGNGHGVGMCQWGTQHLAQLGKRYTEILSYFYPEARLSKISY